METEITKTYREIAEAQGFDELEAFERYLLLNRFRFTDKQLYECASNLADKTQDEILNSFVEHYKPNYSAHKEGDSFRIHFDDLKRLVWELARVFDNESLIQFFGNNSPRTDFAGFGEFRGRYYTYSMDDGKLELLCDWDKIYKDAHEVLNKTKGRAKHFLNAIIRIYSIDKFNRYNYLFGPPLSEVQGVIKGMVGETVMLAPQDYVLLKAYRIYFRSGSKRHPGHSIPFEVVPPIERAIKDGDNYYSID